MSAVVLFLLASLAWLACSEPGATSASEDTAAAATAPAASASVSRPNRRLGERPLPAFQGRTLDGEILKISSLIGKRLVLFIFNPEIEEARPVAAAVASIAQQRAESNFNIVGVGTGSSASTIRAFASEIGLDFPIIDDSSARIANQLGLRAPLVLLSVDPEGYLGTLRMSTFAVDAPDPEAVIAASLRERLRLPDASEARNGELDRRPKAPLFTAERMKGGELQLAELVGKPVVLIFFLHTCPHCHHALAFFKQELEKLPEDKRPTLFGISLQSKKFAVEQALAENDIDFFPVLFDRDESVRNEYGVFGSVPVIVMIDSDGRIEWRSEGWEEGRDPALMRMILAKIAGTRVPMLLNPKGYTGSDACGVCHEAERNTWQFTAHATAYDTLVTHGEARNAECIGCHVVGFDAAGGFNFEEMPQHLENVGCESCHGRGGPHLSPGFAGKAGYEKACLGCHNPTHSLGFEYASFRPKISHVQIASLSAEERQALGKRGVRDVLPRNAALVGSNVCRECHSSEFETWTASPHARAVASLQDGGKAEEAECLKCHTTAFGRSGGFPEDGVPSAHEDLARVGCESCHGPGGDHVDPDAPKLGSIVSLGDKCDSCVILQICGSCHDDVNDPGFEFAVEEKIEKQRHGTVEAGTLRPAGGSAQRQPPSSTGGSVQRTPPSSIGADLAQAFALFGARSDHRPGGAAATLLSPLRTTVGAE